MCGRATLISPLEDIAEAFGIPASALPASPLVPRFNIAPGQEVPIVRPASDGSVGRELAMARWGLVPWWSKDGKPSGKTIQARGETVARSPAFRDAFKNGRCLVVVDGFYEWSGKGASRAAHHVHLAGRGPFALAGVWTSWKSPAGTRLETFAVVTTSASGAIAAVHERMPLVLGRQERDRWLAASAEDACTVLRDAAAQLERAGELVVVPVSSWVNSVQNDDPRCLEPVDAPRLPAQTTLAFG